MTDRKNEFQKEILKEIQDSGFIPFKLSVTELLPPGTMNPEQRAVYDSVYYASTIDELDVHVSYNLCPYAIKGAIATGDFTKFKFVIKEFFCAYEYRNHVVSSVISTSALNHINEEVVIEMVKFLIELDVTLSRYSASMAAGEGYYQLAEYLITQNAGIKELNGYDLYDIVDYSCKFPSFKWLLEHGYKVEKSLPAKILCQEGLYNMHKFTAFKDSIKAIEAIKFLIDVGVTTENKVKEIKSNCELAIEVIQDFTGSVLSKYIIHGASLNTIKFLLEQGASTNQVIAETVRFASLEVIKLLLDNGASLDDGGKIGLQLVNHDNTEIVQYVIEEMAAREIKITADRYGNYPNYIVHRMSKNMDNCEGNKIIADYADLTGQVNWSECE